MSYKQTMTKIRNRLGKLDDFEEQIKPIQAKMSKLNEEISDLKDQLLKELEDEKIDKITYAGFDIRLSSREIPTIKDFDGLCKHAAKTGDWGLFVKRLNTTGFKESYMDEDGNWKKLPRWADIFIKKDVHIKRSK